MKKKQTAFRIDVEILKKLDEIAEKESNKQGFEISRTDIVNKALREFVANYSKKSQ